MKVTDQFEAYRKPRKNVTLQKHNFLTHKQQDGVSFDMFVTELKRRSAQCELGELKDLLAKDMIVTGVANNQLRERFMRTDDLTLDKSKRSSRGNKTTSRNTRQISNRKPRFR